jgi:organic radical activating enzyme
VGCIECDTDYSKAETRTAGEIADRADAVTPPEAKDRWAWITGGEPADHQLHALITALKKKRFAVAVATSGHKRIIPPVDWLSVSPHDPTKLVQSYGDEIKLVDGLHDLDLEEFVYEDVMRGYSYKYVQPLSVDKVEDPASLQRCLEFLRRHPDWALSRQDHHYWGVP